jgi:hypothetical protein
MADFARVGVRGWIQGDDATSYARTGVREWEVLSGGGANIYTITPSGGVSFGGAPAFIKTRLYVPAGTVTFGGTAPFSTSNTYTINPLGGVVLSGNPNQIHIKILVPSGGVIMGGTAPILFIPAGGGGGSNYLNRISIGVSRANRIS